MTSALLVLSDDSRRVSSSITTLVYLRHCITSELWNHTPHALCETQGHENAELFDANLRLLLGSPANCDGRILDIIRYQAALQSWTDKDPIVSDEAPAFGTA